MNTRIALKCKAPQPGQRLIGFANPTAVMASDAKPADASALPSEIVWMPAGDHTISAYTMDDCTWTGMVRCDELGANIVAASYAGIIARVGRVWLDFNHEDGEASAWVKAFSWDPARGIVASVEWTGEGAEALIGKSFYSFSPTFFVDWESGRVAGLVEGHAAGGLVNAPAFGAAMPALIAARLGGAESLTNHAPGGLPGNRKPDTTMNRELMLKVLAALAVTVPASATDEQLTALIAQHADKPASANAELTALKAQLAELKTRAEDPKTADLVGKLQTQVEALNSAASKARKDRANAHVQAAVDRGALKADDAALQAKWAGLIEANESNAELLAAMAGKPSAQTVVISPDVKQRVDGVTAQVLSASLVDSLKAYKAKKTAHERAAIYRESIGPVITARNAPILGPILAANSLGELVGDIVTQKSLTLLKFIFPELFAFSTDFTPDAAKLNQQIVTRIRSVPASSNFVAGTGYTDASATTTDVPITISNHKGIPIRFNANELASTDRDIFGEQVEGSHQRIGLDITASLYALLTIANYTNVTTQALAGFDRSTLISAAEAMNTRGVPRMGRVALLMSSYFGQLSTDASIVSYAAFQKPELLTEYTLPKIAGFQPYEATTLTSPGGENLTGFLGTPDALAIATRVPNDYTSALPGSNNGSVSVVTNPDTGISVQLVQYVNHDKAEAVWRLAYMWGVAKGQVASGQRIASA